MPDEELQQIVTLATECLRAQIMDSEEAAKLEKDVERALVKFNNLFLSAIVNITKKFFFTHFFFFFL